MAADNRSALREFLSSIATIKGDLSNITAPPFVLASQSTVELPSYWAEHPSVFVAPAAEPDPRKRAMLVLRWFLASLKRQQYAGRDESQGSKKPLNAFLGELFFAQWSDESGTTKLVSEQVSHHPPITACYLWNNEHGIRADGYACQQITFSGSVNIKQMGHAILHIDKYNEDYLIPLPNVKIQGILTGTVYPELHGSYELVSSSGFVAEIDFSGKKFLGLAGKKNGLHAALYSTQDKSRNRPLYTVEGNWNESFRIYDDLERAEVEVYDIAAHQHTPSETADLRDQDPWESRRAWSGTINALNAGNMQAVVDEKSRLEESQRAMRRREEKAWEPVFFVETQDDHRFDKLASFTQLPCEDKAPRSFWTFSPDKARNARKPYHGDLKPDMP